VDQYFGVLLGSVLEILFVLFKQEEGFLIVVLLHFHYYFIASRSQ
jgi:hypothetical protein